MEGSRFSLENMSRDEVRAYHNLLLAAAGLADAGLAGIDLTSEEKAQIAGPVAEVKAAKTDEEKTAAVKSLLTALGLTRQRDFMKAVLTARGPATLPELDNAAIKPNGLPPVEDIDDPKPEAAPVETPGETPTESK